MDNSDEVFGKNLTVYGAAMTNDKQAEVWIDEFWDIVEKSPDSIKNSEYNQIRLEGFLMAKRSMQQIELPRTNWNPVLMGHYYSHGEVVKAITAAGYSYKVKE